MRYVGSSTKAHGLTEATMPRRNDSPRFTSDRPVRGDALAELVGVERSGALEDRAVAPRRRASPGRRRRPARRRGPTRDHAAARSVTPRSAANCCHRRRRESSGLTPTKRTDSPTSACTAAKSTSSRAHGGHVEYQRLTTIGRPSEASATLLPSAVVSSIAGSRSIGSGGLVGVPGCEVLARRGRARRRCRCRRGDRPAPDHRADRLMTTAASEHHGPHRMRAGAATRPRLPTCRWAPGGGAHRHLRQRCRRPPSRRRRARDAGRLGGRPHGRLFLTIRPLSSSSPPHTPHGSSRSMASRRHDGRERALGADRLRPGDVDHVVGEEQRRERPVAVSAAGQACADGGGTRFRLALGEFVDGVHVDVLAVVAA